MACVPLLQGLPVDQLLQNISLFASGLEPTASGGAADTGAVAPPPPAATQAGQPTGKAGKRLGGRGGEAGAADGAAVALSVHGSGAAGQLAFARREEQEGGMGRAYAVVWSSRSFLALVGGAGSLAQHGMYTWHFASLQRPRQAEPRSNTRPHEGAPPPPLLSCPPLLRRPRRHTSWCICLLAWANTWGCAASNSSLKRRSC